MERDGSKEPVPYNGIGSGPSLPRRVLPLGLFPQRPATGGVHRESPCPNICGRLREREAGRLPTSWGYYSTPVRILQGGCGGGPGLRRAYADGDGWFCFGLRPPSAGGLAWPAPLSHLPTLQRFWKQGDSPCTPGGNQGFPAPSFERQVRLSLSIAGDTLHPRRGLCPCTPLGGGMGAVFSPGASGRFLAFQRVPGWERGFVVEVGHLVNDVHCPEADGAARPGHCACLPSVRVRRLEGRYMGWDDSGMIGDVEALAIQPCFDGVDLELGAVTLPDLRVVEAGADGRGGHEPVLHEGGGEVGGVYAEPPLLQLWAAAKAVFATAEGGQDNVPLVA